MSPLQELVPVVVEQVLGKPLVLVKEAEVVEVIQLVVVVMARQLVALVVKVPVMELRLVELWVAEQWGSWMVQLLGMVVISV